ncbi:MAG: hypothetical protein WCC84_10130 [Candidatus Cybelea sp.]
MSIRKHKKAANGAGSVKWYPSMRRYVGQVRRNGKILTRKYGKLGERSSTEQQLLWLKLQPYLSADPDADTTLTVWSALNAYASRRTRGGREIAPATRDRYREIVKCLDGPVGAKRVIDVKSSDVEKALDAITSERGASMARTRQIAYKLLRAVFEKALNDGLITRNVVKAVEAPQYHRKERRASLRPASSTSSSERTLNSGAQTTRCFGLL